ncbi:ABC transporter ATP-binding protein [Actinomadura rupiterrae]|uniref:ABC transporter ATP-binding protein n=1 Tax=Actinomadura rupiterrae TaxID=559627 RepID=UPI0020A453EC|nr:ABC transporter ATP-binding protein [Actinomadura rupiterrae]MCP2343199.1 ABC-2 type transport system ATP-binding protein [Actinomadura rupiterrae]
MSMAHPPAVETRGLTKRFGARTALEDCRIEVPAGRVSALIGSNGAGKTTLLRTLCGLARPSEGEAAVLGRRPDPDDAAFLADIGFLAQDVPLYRRMTAADHIALGGHLNARWDADAARERMGALGIPLDRPVARLSGGQRTQLALALTLAKKPRVLLLDEPVAALDPLARHQFLAALSEAVAEGDLTVLMSSHLVHDLERVSDHLVLLDASRVRMAGDIDDILARHRVLMGPRHDTTAIERDHTVVKATHTARQSTLLVRMDGPFQDPRWEVSEPDLEELILAYMGRSPALLATTGELR